MVLFDLPPLNIYVAGGIAVALAWIAFSAGRSAYHNVGRTRWVRYLRWATCAFVTSVTIAAFTCGRGVLPDHVGIGKEKTYLPGWHVYPREDVISLPTRGMFSIPYPNDRRWVEVSYLVVSPDQLRVFFDEIKAFRNGPPDRTPFGTSKKDSWMVGSDAFAAWMLWRTREYLPNTPSNTGQVDSLGSFLKTLSSYGVSTDARLLIEQWRSSN